MYFIVFQVLPAPQPYLTFSHSSPTAQASFPQRTRPYAVLKHSDAHGENPELPLASHVRTCMSRQPVSERIKSVLKHQHTVKLFPPGAIGQVINTLFAFLNIYVSINGIIDSGSKRIRPQRHITAANRSRLRRYIGYGSTVKRYFVLFHDCNSQIMNQ